jgi:hypothetical protein
MDGSVCKSLFSRRIAAVVRGGGVMVDIQKRGWEFFYGILYLKKISHFSEFSVMSTSCRIFRLYIKDQRTYYVNFRRFAPFSRRIAAGTETSLIALVQFRLIIDGVQATPGDELISVQAAGSPRGSAVLSRRHPLQRRRRSLNTLLTELSALLTPLVTSLAELVARLLTAATAFSAAAAVAMAADSAAAAT